MTTIMFDTLKAVEGLEAAGMDSRQAKAVVGTVVEAFEDTVATKTDIVAVRADITAVRADVDKLEASTKADIAEVRGDLKAGIAELKADMFKVAMGVAIAIILANATMTIALIRFLA